LSDELIGCRALGNYDNRPKAERNEYDFLRYASS
jgi:hypothetical protein